LRTRSSSPARSIVRTVSRSCSIGTASPPSASTATAPRRRARAHWPGLQGRGVPRPGGHGHRGPRHRHRVARARRALRPPQRARRLHPPGWTYRAGRLDRGGHHAGGAGRRSRSRSNRARGVHEAHTQAAGRLRIRRHRGHAARDPGEPGAPCGCSRSTAWRPRQTRRPWGRPVRTRSISRWRGPDAYSTLHHGAARTLSASQNISAPP
jgi:hypothetical protein